MVSFRNLLALALAISGGIALGATLPATEGSLVKRGRADIAKEILKAIKIFTDETVYTWVSSTFTISTSLSTPLLLISINLAIRISKSSLNTAPLIWKLEMVVTVMRQWSAKKGARKSIVVGVPALLVAKTASLTLELEVSGTFMAKLNTVDEEKATNSDS
jgi:hypothetical protein